MSDTYLPVHVAIVDAAQPSAANAGQGDATDGGLRFEDVLRQHDALLVTGDPGSGKSTLLKSIALRFVLDGGADFGVEPRLPFLVDLSAYPSASADRVTTLDGFVARELATRGVPDSAELFQTALAHGRALLLLDGLDEVPFRDLRAHVAEEIARLRASGPRGNTFVVTSRTAAWEPLLETFTHCQLLPLNEEGILEYVDRWTRAVTGTDTPEAEQRAGRLRTELMAALRRNRELRVLATNPLLLTGLNLVLLNRGALPTRSIELYESWVEVLLQKRFGPTAAATRKSTEDTPKRLELAEIVRMLATLALRMHEAGEFAGTRDQAHQTFADVIRSRHGNAPEATADFVLQHLAETVGLMVEKPNGGFGFVHVNFQEYFAAVAIAQRAQRSIDTALDILRTHLDDDRWRNVTTLAVAYIGVIQRRDEVAGDLAWDLASTNAGRPGRSIVLAGEAVVAASPDGVSPPARALIVQALPTVIRSQVAAVKERADAGDALASLGDPRFRADMGYLPDEPLLGFVRIDAGPFMVSTWPSSAFDGTWGQRVSHLPAYLIARYPVTVEQFREYIHVSRITAAHPDALLGPSNHPVVGVSWFDAQAYCEWLTRMLRSSDKAAAGITTALGAPGAGWTVRLPTEEQWERAARGGDDRPYPWGMKADPDCANYFDTGLLRTTAVGTFPKGASVDGVEDLSGNVWEWTLSPFDSSTQQRRVLRGGAFSRGEQDIRTTSRNSDIPDARYDNLGFRVVICADSSQ